MYTCNIQCITDSGCLWGINVCAGAAFSLCTLKHSLADKQSCPHLIADLAMHVLPYGIVYGMIYYVAAEHWIVTLPQACGLVLLCMILVLTWHVMTIPVTYVPAVQCRTSSSAFKAENREYTQVRDHTCKQTRAMHPIGCRTCIASLHR